MLTGNKGLDTTMTIKGNQAKLKRRLKNGYSKPTK